MTKRLFATFFLLVLIGSSVNQISAETVNLEAKNLLQKSILFISPPSGTFIEGSSFEVPVYINTKGQSINAIDLYINYDSRKLAVIQPVGTKSIISLWLEAPNYSSSDGTIKLTGTIPGGINTESGLIATITFKAISSGQASVKISNTSRVLANDGQGTLTDVGVNQALYNIIPKPPEGIAVFSETHPFGSEWYNNRNPVFSWEKTSSLNGFSYIFDNNPFTTPDNTPEETDGIVSYNDNPDGLWYFHIKTKKGSAWGATTHHLVRIDSTPPAQFTPEVEFLSTQKGKTKALVSFFSTDALSGIDHYEVGILDKNSPPNSFPIFIETKSPFEVPYKEGGSRVIVRAYDQAGNVTDSNIDVTFPLSYVQITKDNVVIILSIIIIFLLGLLTMHYMTSRKLAKQTNKLIEFSKSSVTPRELMPIQTKESSTFYR